MSHSPTSAQDESTLAAYNKAWIMIGDRITSGRSWSGRERHCLFLNTRDGRMADASYAAGVDFAEDGRGLALVDWDHDGDLDAWITSRSAPRLRLLRNRSSMAGRFVALRLRGVQSNRDGIGARITVELDGGKPIVRSLRAGEGFLSQSSKTVVVGLGQAKLKQVRVRWPGGSTETFTGASQGGRFVLKQGAGKAAPLSPRKSTSLAPGPMKIDDSSRSSASFLVRPVPFPPIQYTDFAKKLQTLPPRAGRATLVVLWSRWCKPCLKELSELAAAKVELDKQKIDVVALNVDRLSTMKAGEKSDITDAALSAVLAKTGIKVANGALDDRNMAQVEMLVRWLFTWRKPMPLPCSFLVDDKAMARVIYRGRVVLKRLYGDVAVLPRGPSAWAARAAAGPGFFHAPPLPAPYFRLAKFYLEHGHEKAALRYFQAETRQDKTNADAFNMVGALSAKAGDMQRARKSFEAAILTDPKHGEALTNLARVLLGAGDKKNGLIYLGRAVNAQPNNPGIRHMYGITLAQAGRLKEARTQLLKTRELDPRAPVVEPLARIERELARGR